MIEAEIKARLTNPDQVRRQLDTWANGAAETYSDTYFDAPDENLSHHERELRVRTVRGPKGTRHLLTFKDRPADAATQSKPEFETLVDNPQTAAEILTRLGYPAQLAFTKDCVNYEVTRTGRRFLATLVTVPEIDNTTFLELETQTAEDDLDAGLEAVRSLMGDLGIRQTDWTTETYTDAVRAARAKV